MKAREFDIAKATELMKQAGYRLGRDGYWQKNSQKIQAKILYISQYHENRLVLLREEAKKAGFDIVLNYQQHSAGYKQRNEKKFDITWGGFGVSRLPPPSYWAYFHSENAKPQTNNLTMTAEPKLDKLIDLYRNTYDEQQKQDLSHQILQFIHDDAAFIPGLKNPFLRVAYWRYMMLPDVPGLKTGPNILAYGWIDERAKKELEEYQKTRQVFWPFCDHRSNI